MGVITAEIELNVPHHKVWKAFQDPQLIAKALPENVDGVEIIEGDGFSAGSVRKLIFAAGSPHGDFLVEKIVSVHKLTHTIVTEQIEGTAIGRIFSYTKVTFKIHGDGHHKTKLIWEFEYESLVADPPLEQAKAGAIRTIKAIEAYLESASEYD